MIIRFFDKLINLYHFYIFHKILLYIYNINHIILHHQMPFLEHLFFLKNYFQFSLSQFEQLKFYIFSHLKLFLLLKLPNHFGIY